MKKSKLPAGVVPYKRAPLFTESSIPSGLLSNHTTKVGTWGLIVVEQGQLRYLITDPDRDASAWLLTPDGEPGLVEPTVLHRVEPLGSVQFYVQFLRTPVE